MVAYSPRMHSRLGHHLGLLAMVTVVGCAPMEGDESYAASEGELTVCAHGSTVEGVDASS